MEYPRTVAGYRFTAMRNHRFTPSLLFCLLPALVTPLACTPKPAESKALVRISNVKVTRTGEQTLKVAFDYDLEPGVKLPLPYKEVLVFPLEPRSSCPTRWSRFFSPPGQSRC